MHSCLLLTYVLSLGVNAVDETVAPVPLNNTRVTLNAYVCSPRLSTGGAYDTLQFLRAVSHAVGAHIVALQPSQHAESSNDDEQLTPTAASASAAASVPGAPAAADTPLRCCGVCLLAPIKGFALVPCGHARFSENCARRVADEDGNCPL